MKGKKGTRDRKEREREGWAFLNAPPRRKKGETRGEEKTAFSPFSNDLDKNASSRSSEGATCPVPPSFSVSFHLEQPTPLSCLSRRSLSFPFFLFPLFFFNRTTNESFEPEESAGYWFLNRRFIVVACLAAWVKVSPGLLAVASKLETISRDKCSRSDIEECEVWEFWEIDDRVFEAEDNFLGDNKLDIKLLMNASINFSARM